MVIFSLRNVHFKVTCVIELQRESPGEFKVKRRLPTIKFNLPKSCRKLLKQVITDSYKAIFLPSPVDIESYQLTRESVSR